MITRTLKIKAASSLALLGIMVVIMSACSASKEVANNSAENYTIKHVPNSENYYEGNIIVEVFDSKNNKLTGALVSIHSDDKKVSELELKTTSMGVFYEEEKNIIVLVSKDGYEEIKTSSIAMSTDKAYFISVRLPEK